MYYDVNRDKKITFITKVIDKRTKNKIKMLSRRGIEPMPTYNQCLSEAKNS